MRKKKLLVVIALVLLALFQVEVASACAVDALVYRVVLLNAGVTALIYLSLVNEIGQPADLWMQTTNAAIIALALAAVHRYVWAYFESDDLDGCNESGFGGNARYAGLYNTPVPQ